MNTWDSEESQEWSNVSVQWVCVCEREEGERVRTKLSSILEMLVQKSHFQNSTEPPEVTIGRDNSHSG